MSTSKFGSGVPLHAVLGGGFRSYKELVPYTISQPSLQVDGKKSKTYVLHNLQERSR